jgi:hypothetical protein
MRRSIRHSELDEIQRAESAAEYGKWKNWYRGDWLAGVYRTRELVQVFSKFLEDPPDPRRSARFPGWLGSLLPHYALRRRSLGRRELAVAGSAALARGYRSHTRQP